MREAARQTGQESPRTIR